jgi:hypothetical protein
VGGQHCLRGNNDYVWVGTAANDAVKMAALKKGYSTYITGAIYGVLDEALKTTSTGTRVWEDLGSNDLGYKIWGSHATVSL